MPEPTDAAEARAALEFVYARHSHDGSGLRLDGNRCRGISSDALAWYAVGMRTEPGRDEYPRDSDDLAACERTYGMAPTHLQQRMEPVLAKYRTALAQEKAR